MTINCSVNVYSAVSRDAIMKSTVVCLMRNPIFRTPPTAPHCHTWTVDSYVTGLTKVDVLMDQKYVAFKVPYRLRFY